MEALEAALEVAILCGMIAFSGFATVIKRGRRNRQLRAIEVWPIAELPDDRLGWVIGRVRAAHEPMVSPLTGRPCVYYLATVEEGMRRPLVHEWRSVPFVIEDDTGRALVEPVGAALSVAFDHWQEVHDRLPPSPAADTLLARHGHSSIGAFGFKWLILSEAVLEVGERVAVLGAGVREVDPERPSAGYRSPPPTRLRLISSRRHRLLISDSPATMTVDRAPARKRDESRREPC